MYANHTALLSMHHLHMYEHHTNELQLNNSNLTEIG